MSPEAINRKLAEWMGWSDVKYSDAWGGWQGYAPDSKRKIYTQQIPLYATSFDAVAEVEARLTQEQRVNYTNELGRVCGTQHEKVFATSMQKTEALCRTLGLWENI